MPSNQAPPDTRAAIIADLRSVEAYIVDLAKDDRVGPLYLRGSSLASLLRTHARSVGEAADRLAALSASCEAPGGWHPIETAPTDGTVVLIRTDSDEPHTASFVNFEKDGGTAPFGYHSGWFDRMTGHYEFTPTHWHPLPTAAEGADMTDDTRPAQPDSLEAILADLRAGIAIYRHAVEMYRATGQPKLADTVESIAHAQQVYTDRLARVQAAQAQEGWQPRKGSE